MYVSTSHMVWIIELIMPMYHTLIHACGASHLWLICMYTFNLSSLVLLGKRCKALALYDTRMSFVTEWSLYCIYMINSNSSAEGILSCVVFMPDQICMRHSPQTTWYAIFKQEQSSFSVYRIPKKFQNDNFIGIENQDELILDWLVPEQNVILVSCTCKQIQRHDGDGMNVF